MVILKYFYEEPAALEVLTPDANPGARQQRGPTMSLDAFLNQPRYYRGYMAGTDLAAQRVGLTAVQPTSAYTSALRQAVPLESWRTVVEGHVTAVDDVAACWSAPRAGMVVVGGAAGETDVLSALTDADRRRVIPALRTVLDAGGAVAFAEPAHDGFDWSVFASFPLKAQVQAAWAAQPVPGVRRFLVPYRRARSEEKFYFERWMLDAGPLPDYIEEV